ncbi:TonB-dependent receptor [Sabulibacter ruber]|uniref:TonB-dependent receptor n=1 Tax=Sabulibacter ruber TaxID=2811901 RepID=UPI001A97A1C4|nr:TonB-dependent receptor [Sabulibacter ruber]
MRYKLLLSFCFLVMGFSGAAHAQQAILRGKITDAVNQEPLAGAAVELAGTSNGVSTGLNGEFRLYATPGSYTLKVHYLGYQDTTFSVSVATGETALLQLRLKSNSNHLSDVLVTGSLQGQARALNQQKNADNIKNIVAADQIGRFPDPNAAEALQRVPGVNIERDQGEGRYVLVRGLAPQFTNINVNGEQIPSPEADVRFVALDAIPSDQLASMEISKSLTPDMDGDAIGGSVNLITRTAQSGRPQISGSLAGGYNNLMDKPNVNGQLQFGQRFGANEKLGFLVNANYYQNKLGSDNWEYAPQDNELELRDYELTRTRTGLSSTIDYKFNPNHEVYVRGLYSRFTDREWRRRYVFVPEDEEIEKLTKDRFEEQSILSINAGAKHTFQRFFLNYEAQYSYGEQDTPYDNEVGFIAGLPATFGFPTPKYPQIDAENFTDNTQYELDEAEFGHTLAKDRNITAKLDLGIPYKLGDNSGLLKFGGKVRRKRKSYNITANKYEGRGGVPTLDAFAGSPVKDSFLGGRYNMGNPLDVTSFIQYFNANPAQFELNVEDKNIDEALEAFDAEENVYAGYGMVRQQMGPLMVLAGLRYEKTNVNYSSKDVIINAAGDLESIRPVEGSSNYDFLLPQLHLKYELNKFTNLRAAATYTYARPNFSELIPSQEINREDNLATVGNANLKPVSAFNLDVLAERYFGNVGVLSGGFFYKKLDDFIYRKMIFASPYPLVGEPIIDRIDIAQSQNGNQANLTGFEVAYQGNLTFLPGFLRNFSLYTNYTYTHSDAKIQSRSASSNNPNATESLRLPGQAKNVGNISLSYEGQKFTARASMNFNGEYLSEIGGVAEEDIYVKNRAQLDFSASYAFNSRFRLFTEFMNLTNQPFERYMGHKNLLIQREFYSWWSRIGVKFDL